MNRISLCAMSAAVVMTACTDYRAQINEAHDDYSEDYVNDGDDVIQAANAAANKMCTIFSKLIERL